MISKEEFFRLYCNDGLAALGIPCIDAEKLGERMRMHPTKTKQDLDDYGVNDALRQNGITEASVMNLRTGQKNKFTTDENDMESMLDALGATLTELEALDSKLKERNAKYQKEVPFLDLLK